MRERLARTRLRCRLLVRTPCTAREAVVAGAGLAVLGALVFGMHVFRAGFLFDDWWRASEIQRTEGYVDAIRTFSSAEFEGPTDRVSGLYYGVLYGIFGTATELHFLWTLGLGVLASLLFYALLRQLNIEPLHAWLMAALVLTLPASDSTRLWLGTAISNWALALCLAGALIAVRGLRADGYRAGVLHAIALALYVASVVTYRIATAMIALSVLLYLLSGASWRRAIRLWAIDLAVIAGAALYVITHTNREAGSLEWQVRHARRMQGEGRELLLSGGIPNGRFTVPLVVVLALVVSAVVLWRVRTWGTIEARTEIRRWLVLLFAGGVAAAAGWAVFVPADVFYQPLAPGMANRTNAAAAFGLVIAIYALIGLAALVAVRGTRLRVAPRTAAAVAGVVGAGVLGSLYVERVLDDARKYQTASDLERGAFATMKFLAPSPPRTSTIYILGFPTQPSPNVFTLVLGIDATGAARLLWEDQTLRAINVSAGSDFRRKADREPRLSCESGGVKPHGPLFEQLKASSYGSTIVINLRRRESVAIRSRRECRTSLVRHAREL